MGLAACSIVLAACSSSAPASSPTSSTVNPPSVNAINCANTWQLTLTQRGLNPGTSRSVLATNVIPPNALWAAFCLYGVPSSGSSNPGRTETLVQEGGSLATTDRALIAEINNGQVIKAPFAYICPLDNGQTYLLMFTYQHQPTVSVAVSLFGCRFITNGVATVLGPQAHARLLAMAGTHTHGGPPLPTPTTAP